MASSIPIQIAETIQTAHINRHPSAAHDINPSTASSAKEPVTVTEETIPVHYDQFDDDDATAIVEDEGASSDEIPISVLRPQRRTSKLPPLPDLRFEQSYLHSIAGADTWWKVTYITVKDQVMMPLVQGLAWNLALAGWQMWNRTAQYSGNSVGSRARRWWYGVNNWKIPVDRKRR